MNTLITPILKLAGHESAPIRYQIDAGSMRLFSASLMDPRAEAGRTSGSPAAPLTFFGGATGLLDIPAGDPRTMFALDLPLPRGWPTVATGDEFQFHRPVTSGMLLLASERFINAYEKQGRAGRLIFYSFRKTFATPDGIPVLTRTLHCAAMEPQSRELAPRPAATSYRRTCGPQLPPLQVGPVTIRYLAMFATATAEYVDIHYDADFARSAGLPGPIIQGLYKTAVVGRMLTEWTGDASLVRSLNLQHRGMDLAGSVLTAGGSIHTTAAADGAADVECDVWVRNADGEDTSYGTARLARTALTEGLMRDLPISYESKEQRTA